jgi:hypothetical protein
MSRSYQSGQGFLAGHLFQVRRGVGEQTSFRRTLADYFKSAAKFWKNKKTGQHFGHGQNLLQRNALRNCIRAE